MWIQSLCGVIATYSGMALVFLPVHFYIEDNTGRGRIRGGYRTEKEMLDRFDLWLYCLIIFLASFLTWFFS